MYELYRITNKVSGSCYIGMTKAGLARRFSQHKYAARSGKKSKLYDAMRKYGVDCFEISLVESFDTKQECCTKEIDLIAKEDNLYNLASGGEGGFAVTDIAAWKAKLCEARTGRRPALGMRHTEENKRFFAECNTRKTPKYPGKLPATFGEANRQLGISRTHYYRLVKRDGCHEPI